MATVSVQEDYFIVRIPTPPMVVEAARIEDEGRPQLDVPSSGGSSTAPTVEVAFDEMIVMHPSEREASEGKTLIVLDAANIGHAFGSTTSVTGVSKFDVTGVEQAFDFFYTKFLNVVVTAFIPAAFVRRRPAEGSNGTNALMQTDELDRLEHLIRQRVLVVVPAGDDDDAYAISYARQHGGFLVSNDHFESHIRKIESASKRSSLKLWLQENRCGYTFAGGEFMPNPSSALVASLKAVLESKAPEGFGPLASVPLSVVQSLESLDHSVEQLYAASNEQPNAIRASLVYLLVARAALRCEVGLRDEAMRDCETVLFLDPSNGAIRVMMLIKLGLDVPLPAPP